MGEFEGRAAFITGAAHGQGRACALALAREGADIAAFDVAKQIEYPKYEFGTSEELKSLKTEIEAFGGKCEIFAGDVRDDVRLRVLDAVRHGETGHDQPAGRVDLDLHALAGRGGREEVRHGVRADGAAPPGFTGLVSDLGVKLQGFHLQYLPFRVMYFH